VQTSATELFNTGVTCDKTTRTRHLLKRTRALRKKITRSVCQRTKDHVSGFRVIGLGLASMSLAAFLKNQVSEARTLGLLVLAAEAGHTLRRAPLRFEHRSDTIHLETGLSNLGSGIRDGFANSGGSSLGTKDEQRRGSFAWGLSDP
jgi:hypothetical protein